MICDKFAINGRWVNDRVTFYFMPLVLLNDVTN
jgi:hypothetical protein